MADGSSFKAVMLLDTAHGVLDIVIVSTVASIAPVKVTDAAETPAE